VIDAASGDAASGDTYKSEVQPLKVELRGVFAPIVTPFRMVGGEIDHAWIREHIAYLQAHRCDGIVACGTNGEAASLSIEERQAVLETALRAAGNLPVIAGTGAAALPDAIKLTSHAYAAGAAAVLVTPPFFFKRPPDAGILAWFDQLCARAVPQGGRVLLYHIPQQTAVPFTDALLAELLNRRGEAIFGIKDSTGDPEQGRHIRSAFPALAYFCGNDHLIGPACGDGAAGSISAAANVFPDVVKAAQLAATSGGASAAQSRLDQVRSTLEKYPLQPATKAALVTLADLVPVAVRPPQIELTPAQLAELRNILLDKLPEWRPAMSATPNRQKEHDGRTHSSPSA
jgi:4-hydroxy-tetrahydrodipicolinate synthase